MICIPIISKKGALKDIKLASSSADLIELRLDLIKSPNLKQLITKSKKPVIITNRKKSEGGKSKDNKKRIDSLKKTIKLNADFVDIELSSGKKTINELKNSINKNKKRTRLIISYHNFKKTPKNLNSIYKKIKKLGPDIIKIVTFANSIDDNTAIFNLIKRARKEKKKIIALCMGEYGEVSRILSPLLGSYLTFASLKKGKESAPGQLTAETLKKIYRINKLHSPKILGLAGNPVSHSKGYLIHNKSFDKLKLNSIYVNFLVEDLKKFIKNYRNIITGLSVTIPHKKEIIKYLDKVDPTAKKIGAVNTVIKKNNKLIGYNTDCSGAIKAIKSKTNIKNKNIVIIGAGGVARAIAFGIIKEKGNLTILNRTEKKAKRLGKELKCISGGLDRLKNLKEIDMIINATSTGMNENKSPVKKQLLKKIMKKNAVVFDSVYTPPKTRLLRDAKSLRLKTVSGLDMFINQAKEQFKLFIRK